MTSHSIGKIIQATPGIDKFYYNQIKPHGKNFGIKTIKTTPKIMFLGTKAQHIRNKTIQFSNQPWDLNIKDMKTYNTIILTKFGIK